MTDFSPLFTYLDEKFKNIDEQFIEQKELFAPLQTSVDNYSKKTDTYHQELAVYKHKVNSMEDWIKKASVKLGVDYNP